MEHIRNARNPIGDKPSETDHTQKRRFHHSDLPNHKSFGYSEVLIYGSEMVLLGVVIGKCEMPSTDISQENDHAILVVKRQFVAYNFR